MQRRVLGAAAALAVMMLPGRAERDGALPGPGAGADGAPPGGAPRPAVALAPLARSGPAGPAHAIDGDARLARAAGLDRVPDSSTSRLLRSFSADELALFARVEQLTGRAARPELVELVRARRGGATPDAVRAAAARLLEGDPLARAAVLEWASAAHR